MSMFMRRVLLLAIVRFQKSRPSVAMDIDLIEVNRHVMEVESTV